MRDLEAATVLTIAAQREDDPKSAEAWRNRNLAQQQRSDAIRKAVAAELAQLPAEIELKVRLEVDEALLGPFTCTRVGPDRLLELLERKNLREDGNWNVYYNNLVVRVVGRAELFFTRQHLERLRAIMDREYGAMEWRGQVAFVVGISHLLPVAKTGNLDDPNSRDGLLRAKSGPGASCWCGVV